MTLPTSGTLSLSQIQTEFGGTNPVSLSEYYKGGANVTSSSVTPNTVPASGLIRLSNFRGAAKSNNLVGNGTFATDLSGWSFTSYNGTSSVADSPVGTRVNNRLRLTCMGSSRAFPNGYYPITCTVNQSYSVSVDYDNLGGASFGIAVFILDSSKTRIYNSGAITTSSGTHTFTFTATTTTMYISVEAESNTTNQYADFDNISVIPTVAAPVTYIANFPFSSDDELLSFEFSAYNPNNGGYPIDATVASRVSGRLRLNCTATNRTFPTAAYIFTTTVGRTYNVSCDYYNSGSADGVQFYATRTDTGEGLYASGALTGSTTKTFSFTAATTESSVSFDAETDVVGHYAEFDNLKIS